MDVIEMGPLRGFSPTLYFYVPISLFFNLYVTYFSNKYVLFWVLLSELFL